MIFNIFISSPGDVRAERDAAERVIKRLGRDNEILERWKLQPVRWDKDSEGVVLDARVPPQIAVNRKLTRPAECQVVLVILGSRMGTPLDDSCRKSDGSLYLSGTEWEYCDAVDAWHPNGTPAVWVYHRESSDAVVGEEASEQKKKLDLFLNQITDNGKGINSYASIDDFSAKFEAALHKELLGKRRPFNAPPLNNNVAFVGRKVQIEYLVKKLAARENQALVYLPGVGKTTLACRIAWRREWAGEFFGVLWADVGKESVLWNELKRWAVDLEIPEDALATLATVDDWRKAVHAEIASRSNMLIILDDIWSYRDGKIFFNLGDNCTYLMTTRSRRIAKELLCKSIIDVDPLTKEQSLELLAYYAAAEIAVAQEKHKRLLTEIIDSLGGLPIALELTGRYLNGIWKPGAPKRLERALSKVHEAGVFFANQDPTIDELASERLIPLFETCYESLDDESRRAVLALSVFRPNPHYFSPEEAEQICAVSDAQLERLEDSGFIKLADDGSPAENGSYSMHRTISEFAFGKLSPDERMAMHGKVLAYFDEKIRQVVENIDSDPLSYASWYRFESVEWQELQLLRFYYLPGAYPEGDTRVASAIVHIYLYAFWWWGYYQPFAFCDALLEDWEQRNNSPKVTAIVETLRAFGKNYPEGYEKKDQPGWPAVRVALLALLRDTELEGPVSGMTPERRHFRAVIDFFLSEAYAYARDGDVSLALQTYESARSSFEAVGDAWNHSWILFYMADLVKDLGQSDEERADHRATARAYCRSSIQLAENMPLLKRDPEVLGNVYRVLGDIEFAEGDYAQAQFDDNRATVYAYAFQGIPQPPDTYTVEFFHEIAGKVAARIAALTATDPAAGRAMREAHKVLWAPCMQDAEGARPEVSDDNLTTAEAVASYLFPDAPTENNRKDGRLEYQAKVRATVCAMLTTSEPGKDASQQSE
ncbi:NB-ARC domain-containing protein [Burkholderia sp. D7]|nr:NB-ARC domain-containing protein [Burkholderia sp. D7]